MRDLSVIELPRGEWQDPVGGSELVEEQRRAEGTSFRALGLHLAPSSKGREPFGEVGLEQVSSEGGKMASVLVDGKDPLGHGSSACILENAGSKGSLA